MAKSKPKRQRKRRPGGRPCRWALRERLSAEEREFERAVAEMNRPAQEALSPDTSPERIATLLVEDFEDLPSPVGFVQTLKEHGSSERVSAVAAEARRLAPGSVTALTIAAEVARTVDRDLERASALLDQALEVYVDPDGVAELAQHMLEAERATDALVLLQERLLDEPEDEDSQEVCGWTLERIHRRLQEGEKLEREEREALARFSGRGLLYRFREALGRYVEERPELQELIVVTVGMWLEELREAEEDEHAGGEMGGDGLEERYEGIPRLAIERAWLLEGEVYEDEEDDFQSELAPELKQSGAPLALLATDPDTSPELARPRACGFRPAATACGRSQIPIPPRACG